MKSPLYVFAYGSLMWRPGFEYAEAVRGRLHGFHRSFCVYSHVHRGTAAKPGLVLGLDLGGSTAGTAYRVESAKFEAIRDYLRAREQVTAIYREIIAPVTLPDRTRVQALCYVVDRSHSQYAGKLPPERQAELIVQGVGQSGANPDYLASTVAHLEAMGVRDRQMRDLLDRVRARLAAGQCTA